jgi:5'-methylthioadenosine phosphorylase
MPTVGIIGGSGLDNPAILKDATTVEVDTPYGKPSSPLKIGNIGVNKVIILARHGHNHQLSPTEVNYRANVYALKHQGAHCIIATTACGSLRNEIARGDFVLLDQFIDFTRKRTNTFYESFAQGAVHTPMADPFDSALRAHILDCAGRVGVKCHPRGTVVTIEGPRFSTRAESMKFPSRGAGVINMSVGPQVAIANPVLGQAVTQGGSSHWLQSLGVNLLVTLGKVPNSSSYTGLYMIPGGLFCSDTHAAVHA